MDFARQLGKRVRKIRLERDMTQAQLAGLANVGANYVPRLERGEMVPSVENTCRIARALGVTVDELCGRSRGEVVDVTQLVRRLKSSDVDALKRVVDVLAEVMGSGRGKRGKRARGG